VGAAGVGAGVGIGAAAGAGGGATGTSICTSALPLVWEMSPLSLVTVPRATKVL